jgi:hypothetical protein
MREIASRSILSNGTSGLGWCNSTAQKLSPARAMRPCPAGTRDQLGSKLIRAMTTRVVKVQYYRVQRTALNSNADYMSYPRR